MALHLCVGTLLYEVLIKNGTRVNTETDTSQTGQHYPHNPENFIISLVV